MSKIWRAIWRSLPVVKTVGVIFSLQEDSRSMTGSVNTFNTSTPTLKDVEEKEKPFMGQIDPNTSPAEKDLRKKGLVRDEPGFKDNRTPKITRNAAKCRLCEDVIESRHRHDFVTCSCGEVSVDGGKSYIRRSARDLNNVIDLVEYDAPEGNF